MEKEEVELDRSIPIAQGTRAPRFRTDHFLPRFAVIRTTRLPFLALAGRLALVRVPWTALERTGRLGGLR